MKLKNTKYSLIGLDIGSTAIRAVQLRRNGDKLGVHAALELELPPKEPARSGETQSADPSEQRLSAGSDEQGGQPSSDQHCDEGLHESAKLDQLQRLVARGGFVGRRVVLHCPTEKADVRPISLPASSEHLPREAVLGALRLQIATNLSIPAERAVFDYFTIGHDSAAERTTVMSTVADGQWVTHQVNLAGAAGLRCVAVDGLPCILARVVNHAGGDGLVGDRDDGSESRADKSNMQGILDLGHNGSTLVVLKEKVPVFCRHFSLGGRELSSILAQQLNIDCQRAEKLKRIYGLDWHSQQLSNDSMIVSTLPPAASTSQTGTAERLHEGADQVAKMIFDILQPRLDEYLEGLTRSLNYAINEHKANQLDQITLCGSAGHMRNLDRYFTNQFGLSTCIAQHRLLDEIVSGLPGSRAQAGAWTTALGLALRQEAA